MSTSVTDRWLEANQTSLVAALATVRGHLERHGRSGGPSAESEHPTPSAEVPEPAALRSLCSLFGLSSFERDLLLLCAGMELDALFATRCAEAQDDPRRPYPTFGLALAAIPGAHWSALLPAAPLRRWRLVEVGPGDTLATSRLRIDERILHYLTGLRYLDERLAGVVEPVPDPFDLTPSHVRIAERLASIWSRSERGGEGPVVQLLGGPEAGTRQVAARGCAAAGLLLHALRGEDVPGPAADRDALARLWDREAILSGSALLVDRDDQEPPDRAAAVSAFVESLRCPVVVAGPEPLRARSRSWVRLDVPKPAPAEQRELWVAALGPEAGSDSDLDEALGQFDMGPLSIRAAGAEALGRRATGGDPHWLWDACRCQARPRLDDLAQRIEPAAGWDGLVLPPAVLGLLRQAAVHVRRRRQVNELWGFAGRGARGLGVSALFAGPSGTGKTLAAEVLAGDLRLDLYRIDLSQVVSKYIGETEKNLRRVFDAAEEGGAVLLFDEADALFGKRSEVKDSHDRYANIEVSYLLQRMEAYRGLAILTTNMKEALDPAFLRRIRFVVHFPFPGPADRAEIWRRIFPSATPVDGLDVERLARLNVAGGSIRNIAVASAFLAADAGQPVRMAHVLEAARLEYAKLERPLTDAELGGWT